MSAVPLIQLELIADPDALADAGDRATSRRRSPDSRRGPATSKPCCSTRTRRSAPKSSSRPPKSTRSIFSYLGEDLLGIPARQATEATGTLTVTWAADVETATVYPAGSLLAVPSPVG